jgi:hypothetical protein
MRLSRVGSGWRWWREARTWEDTARDGAGKRGFKSAEDSKERRRVPQDACVQRRWNNKQDGREAVFLSTKCKSARCAHAQKERMRRGWQKPAAHTQGVWWRWKRQKAKLFVTTHGRECECSCVWVQRVGGRGLYEMLVKACATDACMQKAKSPRRSDTPLCTRIFNQMN